MQFDTNIEIVLKPHWWRTIPVITYGIDDQEIDMMQLNNITTLLFSFPLSKGNHNIWFDFTNKDYLDSQLENGLDMAVEIVSVTIEGMTLDRFRWAGEYRPIYPEPWASTQHDLLPNIKSATYMGWNGRWNLPFTTPIFTWIHRLENLGWLYKPPS